MKKVFVRLSNIFSITGIICTLVILLIASAFILYINMNTDDNSEISTSTYLQYIDMTEAEFKDYCWIIGNHTGTRTSLSDNEIIELEYDDILNYPDVYTGFHITDRCKIINTDTIIFKGERKSLYMCQAILNNEFIFNIIDCRDNPDSHRLFNGDKVKCYGVINDI